MYGRAAPPSDQQLAGSLLAGLRDRVESLRSGVVEFEVHDKSGKMLAKRFAAFDAKEGKVRSDTLVNWRGPDRIVKVIRTKNQFVQFLDNKGDTQLIRLNAGEKPVMRDGMPIDPRALGMLPYGQICITANTAEGLLKSLNKAEVISASLENDIGVIVLDPNVDDGMTQLVWWIDTAHGYVPLRTEVRLNSRPYQRLEASWTRINGVMVPVSSASYPPTSGGELECAEEMHFTWKSVNETIPEELFSVEKLELPEGTYVIDTRLGTPIVEEVVGQERPLPDVPTPQGLSWTRVVMIITSALLLLVVGVIFILRHWQRLLGRS
ncbi:MAG: hypothetical protein ACQESR_18695 [Planctomycetota bacterium]